MRSKTKHKISQESKIVNITEKINFRVLHKSVFIGITPVIGPNEKIKVSNEPIFTILTYKRMYLSSMLFVLKYFKDLFEVSI